METKGKRTARLATPAGIAGPAVVAAEAPSEILVAKVTELAAPEAPRIEVQSGSPPLSALSAEPGYRSEIENQALAALAESRAAMARGLDALGEEVVGLTRCGIDAAARTAIEMLAVKTLSDAIAVNAGFARANFDNWMNGSAKFSELGVKLAVESSRPFLARLGKTWSFLPRLSY
jgi:hypothetical protein